MMRTIVLETWFLPRACNGVVGGKYVRAAGVQMPLNVAEHSIHRAAGLTVSPGPQSVDETSDLEPVWANSSNPENVRPCVRAEAFKFERTTPKLMTQGSWRIGGETLNPKPCLQAQGTSSVPIWVGGPSLGSRVLGF